MRILITGVAGVLGENLVHYFRESGLNSIVGLDISDSAFKGKSDIQFVKGNLLDTKLLANALKDIDCVIHCASAAPSYPKQLIEEIVVNGTKSLLSECFNQGVKRVVYISSTAVYGIPKKSPVSESATLQPYHDPYNIAKISAEKLCDEFRAKGLIIPVLRPRTFVGPGRMGTFAMLNDWAYSGKNFPMLGSGLNRYQFLDTEDLCQAIHLATTLEDHVVNDTFNVGAESFSTIRNDYQAVLDRAGFGKRIIPLPAYPIIVALRILERFNLSPLYKRLYEKLQIDYFVSIDKAKTQLGYTPQYSNAQSLVRCYDWYSANCQSFQKSSGGSNNKPWKQGALRVGKLLF